MPLVRGLLACEGECRIREPEVGGAVRIQRINSQGSKVVGQLARTESIKVGKVGFIVRLSVFRRPFHKIYVAKHAEQWFTWVEGERVGA